MVDEKTFSKLAGEALAGLERALAGVEGVDADLAGDVLTIELDGGRTYVINSHGAARQVWVAANARAWHLSYDEAAGRWVDTREGRELWALVGEVLSVGLGRKVTLA